MSQSFTVWSSTWKRRTRGSSFRLVVVVAAAAAAVMVVGPDFGIGRKSDDGDGRPTNDSPNDDDGGGGGDTNGVAFRNAAAEGRGTRATRARTDAITNAGTTAARVRVGDDARDWAAPRWCGHQAHHSTRRHHFTHARTTTALPTSG